MDEIIHEQMVPALMDSSRREPTDRELLDGVIRGDKEAARLLYERYAKRLKNVAMARRAMAIRSRIDAEDIVQSVFLQFFQGTSKNYYDVPSSEELWPLLLVIASNLLRAEGVRHRAAKRDVGKTFGIDDDLKMPDDQGRHESLVALNLIVDDAIDRLDTPLREIVRLRLDGFEVAEIAVRVGRSKRTVERLLQKCRTELAKLWSEMLPHDAQTKKPPETG
jgi:RNA polymerase sigma-70 factor (ECF subfamily)